MTEQTHERLKEIKRGFRLLMNGAASQQMRQRGLQYGINWGVSIPDLQQTAQEYGQDYDLAIELWKENIRECKVLALMMMPPERMLPELCDLWMEQTPSQELASLAALYLYQHLEYAPAMAFEWIADARPLHQIAGYSILTRLFMRGQMPDERGINELMDQLAAALTDPHAGVRHAAQQCLLRFAEQGEPYAAIARAATKNADLDIF